MTTPIDVFFSNYVKFGSLRCITDKKTTLRLVFSSRYCANRAQNLPQPTTDNLLRVFQMSSKSVHFRRSYIRTREHRQSEFESESNIRLKPSFEQNN